MTSSFKHFVGSLAACAALSSASVQGEVKIPDEFKTGGFFVGCQAYSFHQYTVFEAIEKTELAGGRVIEFYPGQLVSTNDPGVVWNESASDELIKRVQDTLAKHHIKAVNYGVVGISKDPLKARHVFEFAKKLGLRAVTTESADAIDTIEKLVEEFDIMVAFHNHPRKPNNADYKMWDP